MNSVIQRARAGLAAAAGRGVRGSWRWVCRVGAIGPRSAAGRRFGHFGPGSIICFPQTAVMNERLISIGAGTLVGPHVALTVGIFPGQPSPAAIALRIGDRCVIGRGTSVNAHASIEIGDDVWTGPNVYITDQNHGYEDVAEPIGRQPLPPARPVVIGPGCWLGYGAVVLPGARIGRNVVIGANAVVVGEIPECSVAVGAPARVVRRHVPGEGWVRGEGR